MIRVGLLGASGRMGKRVKELLLTEYHATTRLCAEATSSSKAESLPQCDLVIDFSRPEAVLDLGRAIMALPSSAQRPALLVGSTGWTDTQLQELKQISAHTCVLRSPNFSTGALAMLHILKTAAPLMRNLGYLPTILETHHRHKKDSPSGTAIAIQSVLASEFPEGVQTQSVRAGEMIGDHEVTFYGLSDHLTFGHFAQDRSIFARGAIEIGLWLVEEQRNGSASGLIPVDRYFETLSQPRRGEK